MKKLELTALVLIAVVGCPVLAGAYVDPGTGSMILQFLLGGVAGMLCLVKLMKGRILEWFGIGKGDDEE
jgi:hypothetical protein